MKTDIKLFIEHPYFRDSLETWIEWTCSYLPRIGESLNGWVWIDKEKMDRKFIKPLLSGEGEESLQSWKGEISDWLYEVSMETGKIETISYFRSKETPGEIEVYLFLGEK